MNKLPKLLVLAGLTMPMTGFAATGVVDLSLFISDEDNEQFGLYNDFPESGGKFFAALDLRGDLPWSEGTAYWQAEGKNIGLQSYDFSYTLADPARYTVTLTFDGSQQYTHLNSKSPFLNGPDGTLTLPNNWMAATTSAGMTAFDSTARKYDEEVHRDSINLDIKLILNQNWQLDFTYQTLNRQGTQLTGAAVYFDASTSLASLLPVEIDEDSTTYRTNITFANDRLTNTLSFLVSTFDDNNDQISWINPFSIPNNTNIGYPNGLGSLSLAPDNEREEIRTAGSYRPEGISGLNIQWDAAWSETEQDSNLLPYTANSTLNLNNPIPIARLDSSVDLINGNLRVVYRPQGKTLRKLLLKSRYSVDDRNYDKNRAVFNYVRGDAANQPNSIQGIFANAHDYRKESGAIGGDYRLPWWRAKATAELERTEVERQNAAVKETDTDTLRGIVRGTPVEHINVRIEAAISDRSSSIYQWDQSFLANRTPAFIAQTPVDQRYDNHPLLSQFHLANAETDDIKVSISYTGIDGWSFAFDLQQQDIDYDKTVLGLKGATTGYYGIDIQFLPSEFLSSYAVASWSLYETDNAGRSFGGGIEKPANRVTGPLPEGSDPTRNWLTSVDDEVFTISTGLLWQGRDRLSAEANYTFVRTESGFKAETGGAASLDAAALPDLKTKLHSINLSLIYQINDKTDMTVAYHYFDFDDDDWATSNVGFDSVPNLLGAEQSSLDGNVNLLGVSFKHGF